MEDKDKTNPFINALLRLSGEWPLFGTPPLTEQQYKDMFVSAPSFADYIPIVEYDDESDCYLMDDLLNVAKIYTVKPSNMSAKSENYLEDFNAKVTQALNSLPTDDDHNPYILQIYLSSQPNTSIYRDLKDSIVKELHDDEFTKEILKVTKEHDLLLTHEKGVFDDSRIKSTEPKGWRVSDTAIYLCLYKKHTKASLKGIKKKPTELIQKDLAAFRAAVGSAGIQLEQVMPGELINWLAPLFGHKTNYNDDDISDISKLANFDIGQLMLPHQSQYHFSDDPKERGIYRFSDTYSRYLTIGGINNVPTEGRLTLGDQTAEGSEIALGASIFERLPVGTIFSYTIIPQSDYAMKKEITTMLGLSGDGASNEAQYAKDQALSVQQEMLVNQEKVFYVQMGIFITANSVDSLLDVTEYVTAEMKGTRCIEVIKPSLDLLSQDSYIRALPCVYDWQHDRNNALRARKVYTSHLSSLLPFFGNRGGSDNPCNIMFSRSGEPFYLNPIKDRLKVAHEVFFGPSGSGKSATVCYMTLMSMAVNNPRTFLFDYGNSFKLLGDFAEKHGKKVRRLKLSANSGDVLAPFFETQKALNEHKRVIAINNGTHKASDDNDNDEERSYLAEMEYVLRIMVTGGTAKAEEALTQSDVSRIQDGLIRGLQISVEKGEDHARPIHIRDALMIMSEEEASKEGGIDAIALKLRDMADSLSPWTKGLRGTIFNQISKGFAEDDDLTIIEIGNLGKSGSADMLAVAGLSSIYTITALAEKTQNSGRPMQIRIDETHLWAKVPMLLSGLLVAAKVFRKLNTWLCIITQDVSDFKGEASKIITNSEFLWLMKMSKTEVNEFAEIIDLSDDVKHLLKFPKIENHKFVEGVSISDKHGDALIRIIPPSLILALAQTDGNEKDHRSNVMKEHGCDELEAAYIIGEEIHKSRVMYQNEEHE